MLIPAIWKNVDAAGAVLEICGNIDDWVGHVFVPVDSGPPPIFLVARWGHLGWGKPTSHFGPKGRREGRDNAPVVYDRQSLGGSTYLHTWESCSVSGGGLVAVGVISRRGFPHRLAQMVCQGRLMTLRMNNGISPWRSQATPRLGRMPRWISCICPDYLYICWVPRVSIGAWISKPAALRFARLPWRIYICFFAIPSMSRRLLSLLRKALVPPMSLLNLNQTTTVSLSVYHAIPNPIVK